MPESGFVQYLGDNFSLNIASIFIRCQSTAGDLCAPRGGFENPLCLTPHTASRNPKQPSKLRWARRPVFQAACQGMTKLPHR
jgi:hypothetical protein